MPDSTEKKLNRLYVIVGETEDGREGIAAVTHRDGTTQALVGLNDQLPQLRAFMKLLASMEGKKLTLTEWGERKDLESIIPEKPV